MQACTGICSRTCKHRSSTSICDSNNHILIHLLCQRRAIEHMPQNGPFYTWIAAIHPPLHPIGTIFASNEAGIASYVHMCSSSRKSLCVQIRHERHDLLQLNWKKLDCSKLRHPHSRKTWKTCPFGGSVAPLCYFTAPSQHAQCSRKDCWPAYAAAPT